MENVIVTVRFIRSFEQRNIKHVVHKNVDLSQTVGEFLQIILLDLQSRSGIPPPVKKYNYDTLKIQHQAHGAKTTNPVINTETEDFLEPNKTLADCAVANETEISCFKSEDYKRYRANPETRW